MYRKILQLAGPIIFANILQMVYQMTDLFWIGRYSTEGVAAISLAGPVIFFFLSLGIGLMIAGTIMVAQARGSKQFEKLNNIVGQTLTVTTIYSLVVSVIGFFAASTVIGWMDAEPVVQSLSSGYLQISFIGMFAVFGYMSVQSLWRGMGEVIKPVYIVIGTALLNLVLDPALIMGRGPIPSLGVDGAAWATMITQSIAFVIALVMMFGTDRYHLTPERKHFGIHPDFIKTYFGLAIPSSIEMSARSLGMVVLAGIVAALGTTITAAYGVGNQLFSIILFVALGFSMAATTLAGQLYGAKDYEGLTQMRQKALTMTFWTMVVLGLVTFALAPQIVGVFVPGETEVIAESTRFVRIIALFLWSIGVQQIYTGMFRGLGETRISMVLTMVALRALQIPIAYFGSRSYGPDAIWRSLPISNVIIAVVAWARYGQWRKRKVREIVGV